MIRPFCHDGPWFRNLSNKPEVIAPALGGCRWFFDKEFLSARLEVSATYAAMQRKYSATHVQHATEVE
jgi:hypothetical protein